MTFGLLFEKYKKACITGYSIRCIYGLLLVLRSKTKSKGIAAKLKQIFFTLNHYQFASSIGSATATYAFITHLLTKNKSSQSIPNDTTQDKNNANVKIKMFAIIVSLVWLRGIPKSFRETVVLHLFVRAMYDLIKLLKYDQEYKMLPNIPNDEMFLGAASLTAVGYGIYHNPWIFDKSFYKFILKWGSNTHEQIGNVFRSKIDPMSPVRLEGEAFVECCPEWHSDPSCFRFHTKNIGRDFLRSNGMYAFVHCAPLLISAKFWKTVYGAIHSVVNKDKNNKNTNEDGAKLHFSKLMQCYWRHYVMRSDPIWSTVLIVYIATLLAELFETPKRRIQYTLYTSTHVMRMIGNAIQLKYGKRIEMNHKLNWIYNWWSIIILQITFSIWSFMKSIGRDKQFCSYWSQFAMDTII